MPSKLARNFSQRRQQIQLAREVSQGRQTLGMRGPFLGYQPDIDANLTDGTAFDFLRNVLARAYPDGELLGLPDGFRQVDSATLPLGDIGNSIPASPLSDAQPIVRIDQIDRTAPTAHATAPGDHTAQWQVTPMVVTAGDGTTNASGNMYRLNASGAWALVAEAASMTAARALKADRDGRTTSPSMPDSCVAPFGAVARAANTSGGDDLQSGAITEPCWIFTNDVDEVMVFPAVTAAGGSGADPYEPLCDETSSPDLDGGGADGFKAKSVETWNGRVYFLNTSENGIRRQQRLRRTAKFTADPDPTIVGAGFFDFREFQGEGLRIETLGDVLAVYFSDGVAFLRPTGVPTSPDEPQVISTERGLLSTHSVVPIGRNVHFGIFTDGWWLIDQSGRWQELGVVNIDGKIVPKWRQTFYSQIPSDQRHRLYVNYDQPNNLIYIARPTNASPDPQQVWIYDPTSDRVFIENYPVTCFGTITPASSPGVTIDSVTEPIDDVTETIDSFAPVAGFPKVRCHGDLTGYVYQHRRDLVGYDSASSPPVVQEPLWRMNVGLRSPAGLRNLTTIDRVTLEYFNRGNLFQAGVEAIGPSADGSQSQSFLLDGGNIGDLRTQDAWFRYSSQAPGLRISGFGEYQIRALAVDIFADPVETRGL